MSGFNSSGLTIYGFYLLWGLILFLSFYQKEKKVVYIMAFFMLVFSVFRYGSGTDYFAYKSIYESTLNETYQFLSLQSSYETLYFNFMIFSHSLGFNFFQFVALHSILLMFVILLWIKMSSRYPVTSLFLYFSFFYIVWNLSAFRQVIPLLLGSFIFYNEKINIPWWSKFVFSLFLVFFHFSALFYSALLIIELISWNKKRLILFFVFALAFSFIPIREMVLQLNISDLIVNTSLYQKFFYYLSGMPATIGFFEIESLMRVFFIVLVMTHYDELIKISPFMKRIVEVLVVGLSLFFILKFNLLTAQRFTIYALVLLVMILPEIVHLYDDKNRLIKYAVLAAFIALNVFMYYKDLYAMKDQKSLNEGITSDHWLVEYHHIFEPGILEEIK